ncbi:hypothetical protein ABT369_39385 [Dactylosporangium sp. NPDC000244]|uniref:hypothetical protein n=1 Tax=Dactylosporangium sp. NPDC000244 TaxID=3154365 RepID=UPI003333E78C
MTEDQANAVYNVLVEHAGAREDDRDAFVYHVTHGCEEYRFQGVLGFGGKLYVEPRRWRVSCYREDETPARVEAIWVTNEALAELRAAAAGAEAPVQG